jgi:hypothetical protein
VSLPTPEIPCRFCRNGTPAVAIFTLPKGCFVYAEDREQALCCQHIVRATSIGEMTLKTVLDGPTWEWFKGSRR